MSDSLASPEAPARPVLFRLVLSALFAALLALPLGLWLGQGMSPQVDLATDRVSAGFLDDMSTHHAQAVEMSAIMHARSQDPQLRQISLDILTTQQGQIGIMSAWRDAAGRPFSDEPVMGWMNHTGPMPGMASRPEINQLASLPIERAEELWLRLMIRHHAGALPMAAFAARDARSPQVRTLARSMETFQVSEIDAMNALLTRRNLPPESVDLSGHTPGGHSSSPAEGPSSTHSSTSPHSGEPSAEHGAHLGAGPAAP